MRDHVPSNVRPSGWKDEGGRYFARPELGFAAATIITFGAWAFATTSLSPDAVMPLVASSFLGFAAVFGLVGWFQQGIDITRVTFADVAGALTLIGICAAVTIEPEQLARLMETGRTDTADSSPR